MVQSSGSVWLKSQLGSEKTEEQLIEQGYEFSNDMYSKGYIDKETDSLLPEDNIDLLGEIIEVKPDRDEDITGLYDEVNKAFYVWDWMVEKIIH